MNGTEMFREDRAKKECLKTSQATEQTDGLNKVQADDRSPSSKKQFKYSNGNNAKGNVD